MDFFWEFTSSRARCLGIAAIHRKKLHGSYETHLHLSLPTFSVTSSNAAISLSGPSVGAGWITLGANYDFINDQQTGDPASDIVGTGLNPGFFTAFDNAGTSSLTDGGTLNDLTPTGTDTDYYVSFSLSFANLAVFLTAQLPSYFNQTNSFNENTPLRYVLGTSTQSNSLNQDLGGINNKTANLTSTWTLLGGFSRTISAAGNTIPEVSATILTLIGSVFGSAFNRRRAR